VTDYLLSTGFVPALVLFLGFCRLAQAFSQLAQYFVERLREIQIRGTGSHPS
jgi:hypothetical protein